MESHRLNKILLQLWLHINGKFKRKKLDKKKLQQCLNSKTNQNQHKKYMHLCGSSFCCEYKCVFPTKLLSFILQGKYVFSIVKYVKKKINIASGILELLKASV